MTQKERLRERQALAHKLGLDQPLSWRATAFCIEHRLESLDKLRDKVRRDYRFLKRGNFGFGTYNELRKAAGLQQTRHDEPTLRERVQALENQLREAQGEVFELQLLRNRMLARFYDVVQRTVIDRRPLEPREQRSLWAMYEKFQGMSARENWLEVEP
jgi:hypothetical protein